jgi:hypothetical protein
MLSKHTNSSMIVKYIFGRIFEKCFSLPVAKLLYSETESCYSTPHSSESLIDGTAPGVQIKSNQEKDNAAI